MSWHARLTLLLLGRRCKTWASLSGTASHYALKQVCRTMTNGRRLRLRGASRTAAWASALLQVMSKARDFFLIST
jgi:hypothetical protein